MNEKLYKTKEEMTVKELYYLKLGRYLTGYKDKNTGKVYYRI